MEPQIEIIKQIEDAIKLKKHLIVEADTLITISNLLVSTFRNGNKVLLFGNGGSASDAEHIACELSGKYYRKRNSLPAIALTANTSSLTAIANDFGYESVFSTQVQGLAKKGDVVIAISTSGESPNVIRGVEEAKKCGAITIAFTGEEGKLKSLVDYVISIPSKDTPRIQEAHITAGHIICYLIEEVMFGDYLSK